MSLETMHQCVPYQSFAELVVNDAFDRKHKNLLKLADFQTKASSVQIHHKFSHLAKPKLNLMAHL